jgi:hypothetical protein
MRMKVTLLIRLRGLALVLRDVHLRCLPLSSSSSSLFHILRILCIVLRIMGTSVTTE